MSFGSCVYIYKPLQSFSVDPYTRKLNRQGIDADRIFVIIDSSIKDSTVTINPDLYFNDRFRYENYRSSIEASLKLMLEDNFGEVVFMDETPPRGLSLHVNRLDPKTRPGELISEDELSLEFLFDYDMSLSAGGKTIANAVGYNAHPVGSAAYRHVSKSWGTIAQTSMKLVLEECFNELFVEGLQEL
ncbi:MAG: hypothetical protein AB8F78_19290 [Saprospiraceae bacterium]